MSIITDETISMPYVFQSLDTFIDNNEETLIVAVRNAIMIGCVVVRHIGLPAAWFHDLYVVPDHRRNRLGSQLVDKCIDRAKMSGCATISGSIAPCNLGVLPFYKQLGFVIAAELDSSHLLITKVLE